MDVIVHLIRSSPIAATEPASIASRIINPPRNVRNAIYHHIIGVIVFLQPEIKIMKKIHTCAHSKQN